MKDIKGYEELYAITSCGKVWSYKSKKFLSPGITEGYSQVGLMKDGKRKYLYIHRLVAEAYIPNPNGYDTIDHIDGNKTHNYINNLQWMKNTDNIKKTQCEKVMCVETGEEFDSLTSAAKHYGVTKGAISNAIKKGTKSCGFHWKKI